MLLKRWPRALPLIGLTLGVAGLAACAGTSTPGPGVNAVETQVAPTPSAEAPAPTLASPSPTPSVLETATPDGSPESTPTVAPTPTPVEPTVTATPFPTSTPLPTSTPIVGWRTDVDTGSRVGDLATDTIVEFVDGSTMALSEIADGKPLLLYFFATW